MADAADPVPGWTRREQIELDGLKFDICVAASGGECIGVWKCRDCGEHGASARKNSTADQASTRAQIDLALITTWFTADHANQSESAHSAPTHGGRVSDIDTPSPGENKSAGVRRFRT